MINKTQVFQGSAFLMIRAFLNAIIAFGVVFYVIFVAGGEQYGVYAGALALFNFIDQILKAEIRLHLLKFHPKKEERRYASATTVLFIASFCISFLVLLVLGILPELPDIIESYQTALFVFFGFLPLTVTSEIPRAMLEHRSQFKQIALDEFTANVVQYSIALLWTFYFQNWKGLLYGWVCYQSILTSYTWYRSGFVPYFRYHRKEWRQVFRHGYELSFQHMLQQSQKLVNPLVVGHFLGTQGVGIVAFAEKIIQGLSFFREALYRVSASILGKVKPGDKQFTKVIQKGIFLQVLPLGALLLSAGLGVYIFSIQSNDLLWDWVNALYPFLATSYFFLTIFTIPVLSLQMYERNREVFLFMLVKSILLIVSALILVYHYGIIGYGLAEFVTIPLYYFIYRSVKHEELKVLTNNTQILMICVPIALMWHYIGTWTLFALPMGFLLPNLISQYREVWKSLTEKSV